MGYLIELDDLRLRIKHPPEVPPPMEAWSIPEVELEAEVGLAVLPEPPAGTRQLEFELILNEPGH